MNLTGQSISFAPGIQSMWTQWCQQLPLSGDYPSTRGFPRLLEQIARLHKVQEAQLTVTQSATEALFLSFLALRHCTVLLQVPAYFDIYRQLEQLSLSYRTWSTLEELGVLLGTVEQPVVYACPNFDAHRLRPLDCGLLLGLLRTHPHAQVIWDDSYALLPVDCAPCMPPEHALVVGSLSKVCGGALRLGYVTVPPVHAKRIHSAKLAVNLSTNLPTQMLAAHFLAEAYVLQLQHVATCVALWRSSGIPHSYPGGGIMIRLPRRLQVPGIDLEDNRWYYPDQTTRAYTRVNCLIEPKIAVEVITCNFGS